MTAYLISGRIYSFTVLILISVLLLLTSCTHTFNVKTDAERITKKLDEILLDKVLDNKGDISRNSVLYINAPNHNFIYEGAFGIGRADTNESMTIDHQFMLASVGKTFTAAMIFQLWEEGYFGKNGLDSTLAELGIFPDDIIQNMSIVDGVSFGCEISIRHLLNHTSGIIDMKWDGEFGLHTDYPNSPFGAPDSLQSIVLNDRHKGVEALITDLKAEISMENQYNIVEYISENSFPESINLDNYYLYYRWPHWDYEAWRENPDDKMAGIINFHLSGCNNNSLWKPGEGYYYSDTGYIILAYVIEKLTGNTFHYEQRKRILEPLHMEYTFMDSTYGQPEEMKRLKMSDMWAMNYPCATLNISITHEWGGGGQISTVKDLDIFVRALVTGKLFENPETFMEMLKYTFILGETSAGESFGYGGGIMVIGDDENRYTGIGHMGSSGCWLTYSLESEISFIGTVNEEHNEGDIRRYELFKSAGRVLRGLAPFIAETAEMLK